MKRMWQIGGAMALLFAPMALGQPAAAPKEEMAPIAIELPEPSFTGTPVPYWSPNLEPEDIRDRPPYMAPKGTAVVSKNKPVASSAQTTLTGELKQITDGNKDYAKNSVVELPAGAQWIQIDLQQEYDVRAVLVWHFHADKKVYFDVVVQASNDPEFKTGISTLYNNDTDNSAELGIGQDKEYIESYRGRLVGVPNGVKARYIRLYSKGNSAEDLNHYIEVEVFGRPAG